MKSSAERLKEIIDIFHKYHFPKQMNPSSLRMALEDLGPTFVKMGQIMASREDLIPKDYCIELARLRSSVKPMNYDVVQNIIENEFGKKMSEIFQEFEKEPIGSASIAEVHKAKLITGETIAVKVQRENIEHYMRMDMNLLKKAISLFRLNKIIGDIIDLNLVVDEVYERTKEEMDFQIEKKHIKEFEINNKGIEFIKTIHVFEQYCTSKVLTMEYIDGININDQKTLLKSGYDLNEIGDKLASNYIHQAIDDGFYHADPHVDNIKIVDGKIVYLDFGMMGRLSKANRDLLEKCMTAIVEKDINEVAHILVLMDTKVDFPDYMKLKNDLKFLLEKYESKEIIDIDIKLFLSDFLSLLQSNNITLPKEITMLVRGIVVLEGTLEEISPDINLIRVLQNRFQYSSLLSKDKIRDIALNSVKSGASLMVLPNEALTTLKGINSGELRFNIELTDSKHQIDRIERIVHLLIITVLDVAFILGTSQIIVHYDNGYPFIFYVYLFGTILCTLWLLYKLIMSKFKR